MRISFRNGFLAGLVVAVIFGAWCFYLWQPARQVLLHSEHLAAALEDQDWTDVEGFLDPSYSDQWGHDGALLVTRLRQVLPYARNLHIEPRETIVRATGEEGEWRARVTIEADPNEVSDFIKSRINPLEEPFVLTWRKASGKPWHWKLVRVTNPSLELSPMY